MESQEQEILRLQKESEKYYTQRNGVIIGLVFVIILLLVMIGYRIYLENGTPLFGKLKTKVTNYSELQNNMNRFKTRNRQLQNTIDSLQASNQSSGNNKMQKGVWFEVQIGAFNHFDLSQFKKDMALMDMENANQMDKYLLGRFKSYQQAKSFKKDIRKMGVEDAFIVGKIDGKRVDIKKAINRSKNN